MTLHPYLYGFTEPDAPDREASFWLGEVIVRFDQLVDALT